MDSQEQARSASPRRSSAIALLVGVLTWLGVAAVVGAGGGWLIGAASRSSPERSRMVIVSIPPLRELVAPLLAEGVGVETILPPGRSEHGFEPTPGGLAAIARAERVVFVGAGLEEGWGRQLRARPAIGDRVIELAGLIGVGGDAEESAADNDDHEHAHDHGHAHGPVDPHIWLDPVLTRAFVEELHAALPESLRRPREEIAGHLARIEAVDAAYREALAPLAGRALVTHHNAFKRLAERYGLKVAEVMTPVDTAEPAPAQIAAVRNAIEVHGVRAVFIEPQYDAAPARRIAEEAGVPVGELDPLGQDWFLMMRTNLEEITGLLSKE